MELCGTAGEPGAQLWGAHGGAGTTPSKESPVLSSPSGSEGCPSEPPLPLHHRLHWVLRHTTGHYKEEGRGLAQLFSCQQPARELMLGSEKKEPQSCGRQTHTVTSAVLCALVLKWVQELWEHRGGVRGAGAGPGQICKAPGGGGT